MRRTLILSATVATGGVLVPVGLAGGATEGATRSTAAASAAPRPATPTLRTAVPAPPGTLPGAPNVPLPATLEAANAALVRSLPGLPAAASVRALRPFLASCVLATPRARTTTAKAADPQVLAAFGVLRRARTSSDALSAEARRALAGQGVDVPDLEAARLLRTTPAGGKAWIVPVADARPAGCGILPAVERLPAAVRPATRRLRPLARPPVQTSTTPAPRPVPTTTTPAPRPVPTTTAPAPTLPRAPAARVPRPAGKPEPGVVVVATGDAGGGAGGTLKELVRGLAPVETRPCTGPSGDLLQVSGLVPDGVGFVHLTRTDGTAVRADVTGNGYVFQVQQPVEPGQTYVTWTGGDGTPHVQPIAALLVRCPALAPRVSP